MLNIVKAAYTPVIRRPAVFMARSLCELSPAVKVKNLIAKHKLLVFSKTTCGFCASVKSKLASIGVTPTIVELNEVSDGVDMQAELHALTGQRTVPSVFVGGQHIGGCDATVKLIDDGSFQMLLKNAEI